MSHDEFSGKPPKSSAHIRRILKSIHNANETPHPGPYIRGFPPLERKLVAASAIRQTPATRPRLIHADSRPRTAAYYRELLMRRGGFAGGFVGLLQCLNVGLALPIILGNLWLFAFAPFVASLCGCAVGLSTARVTIVERRRDLFGQLVPSRC